MTRTEIIVSISQTEKQAYEIDVRMGALRKEKAKLNKRIKQLLALLRVEERGET